MLHRLEQLLGLPRWGGRDAELAARYASLDARRGADHSLAACRRLKADSYTGIVPAITLAIFTWFAPDRRALAYSLANTVQQTAYILCPPFVAAVTLSLGNSLELNNADVFIGGAALGAAHVCHDAP